MEWTPRCDLMGSLEWLFCAIEIEGVGYIYPLSPSTIKRGQSSHYSSQGRFSLSLLANDSIRLLVQSIEAKHPSPIKLKVLGPNLRMLCVEAVSLQQLPLITRCPPRERGRVLPTLKQVLLRTLWDEKEWSRTHTNSVLPPCWWV